MKIQRNPHFQHKVIAIFKSIQSYGNTIITDFINSFYNNALIAAELIQEKESKVCK